MPGVDWQAVTDVVFGCANQAGEDNRNVAHMASLLAGLPLGGAGRHDQPPVRFRAGCAGHGGSRDPCRRGRNDDRRWCGEHEPCALRDAQDGVRHSAAANAVYDTTIGWRFVNRPDEGAIWRRCDAGDGGERRNRVRHRARSPGPHGPGQPDEGGGCASRRASSTPRSRPCSVAQKKGDALVLVTRDEHPRATSIEALARLKRRRAAGWHRHCRQCQRRERRRMRAAAGG
jgi:acetyl-CoA acyltransferase